MKKMKLYQRQILLNYFKISKLTYITVQELAEIFSYLYDELNQRDLSDKYDFEFFSDPFDIERSILYNNHLFKIDSDSEIIYLLDSVDLSNEDLMSEHKLDRTTSIILESKITGVSEEIVKKRNTFTKACELLNINLHEFSERELKDGYFIKYGENEIIKIVIGEDGNIQATKHDAEYYINQHQADIKKPPLKKFEEN